MSFFLSAIVHDRCLKWIVWYVMEEREKMVLFSQNIKIVEDLQGAWGRYSATMETHRYKNGTCLLITAAHCNILFLIEGRLWGS